MAVVLRIFSCLLLAMLVSHDSLAQNKYVNRKPAAVRSIPEEVKVVFKEMYPNVLVKGWYVTHLSYWQGDVSAGWYSGWYGERKVVVYKYQRPMYYEVEFIDQPGELSRAIFNVYGYWHETRTKIPALPPEVTGVLEKYGYFGWRLSELKERIESPALPVSVYRFHVSKGGKSRILRIDSVGYLLQEVRLD